MLDLPQLLGLSAGSVPLLHLLAAALPARSPLHRARLAAAWGLLATVALGVGWALLGPSVTWQIRTDAVTVAVLGLVNLVGFVIARFSDAYLDGDPRRDRFARALSGTLAAVSTLVVSNHLAVIAAAWACASLCLHPLLTHFDRPAARAAAHEKFLLGRASDLLFLGALALLASQTGTLAVDALAVALTGPLSTTTHGAALLVAGAVMLRSAQLPVHGWLARVMEAPTPVSALLHAGIVNIGGFVLIRLAPLMAEAAPAQTLLVAVGTTTAVVASLVATTQTTVKGALAWSTMSQMGFMLMQCGLGAWPLALLHLLAHSLYKAHAFLTSGSAVDHARALRLASPKPRAALGTWLATAPIALLAVAAVGTAFGADPAEEPALWALATVLALAIAPLGVAATGSTPLIAAGGGLAVATLYFTWHATFAAVMPPGPTDPLRVGIVLTGFGAAFVAQAWMSAEPGGRVSRALYPPLAAGLHLDELFSRLVFTLWPPRRARTSEG